ncbi:hypothetical protein ACPSL3_08265 [Vibrio owensii]|uniref:hypothetical protein n=1 Tax=Vibrio owensii TaxID=696485 RepID=UPI003CE5AD22
MNNDFEKDFNLGGSVERALSGKYELKAAAVFSEAWRTTIQQFLSFSPALLRNSDEKPNLLKLSDFYTIY